MIEQIETRKITSKQAAIRTHTPAIEVAINFGSTFIL